MSEAGDDIRSSEDGFLPSIHNNNPDDEEGQDQTNSPPETSQLAATMTKQKLNKLMSDFISFDDNMKIGTRQRREKDEHRLAEMHAEMNQLNLELQGETRRRIEMNKSIEAYCEKHIERISVEFKDLIARRKLEVEQRIEKLELRIGDLESEFALEKVKIPAEIERYIGLTFLSI